MIVLFWRISRIFCQKIFLNDFFKKIWDFNENTYRIWLLFPRSLIISDWRKLPALLTCSEMCFLSLIARCSSTRFRFFSFALNSRFGLREFLSEFLLSRYLEGLEDDFELRLRSWRRFERSGLIQSSGGIFTLLPDFSTDTLIFT